MMHSGGSNRQTGGEICFDLWKKFVKKHMRTLLLLLQWSLGRDY
jgi:hypothetical protein